MGVGISIITLLAIAIGVASSSARAEALPFAETVRLGRPPRAMEVKVEATPDAQTKLVVGGRSWRLPAEQPEDASVQQVELGAANASAAIVRIRAGNGSWEALLGGPKGTRLLATVRSDLRGDPGERRAERIRLNTSSKSEPSVWLATRYERVDGCDGAPWPFSPRRLNPRTWRLEAAAPELPAQAGPPRVGLPAAPPATSPLFALTGVATTLLDAAAQWPRRPTAALDGDPATSIALGQGDMALFRWPVSAPAITQLSLARADRGGPVRLWLWSEQGVVPLDVPAARAGTNVELSLDPPISGSCLALIGTEGGSLKLAELGALTELDRHEGLVSQVKQLEVAGEEGRLAFERLSLVGARAAQAVAARFPTGSATARRRGLSLLAAGADLPEVQARLLEVARSLPELRGQAIALLAQGGPHGRERLRELALEASSGGDQAALELAGLDGETPALLAALRTERGPARAALQKALAGAARREEHFDAHVSTWLEGRPPVGARIRLAQLAAATGRIELATHLAEGALDEARSFVDRYRLAELSVKAAPSAKLHAWLRSEVEAEEWMQRRAVYQALMARGAKDAGALSQQLAQDAYPRVRAQAARHLVAVGAKSVAERLAKGDRWPMVRASAATALAASPDSRALLRSLVSDPSRLVRAAAIGSLAEQGAREAWTAVSARLEVPGEWPEVLQAVVDFAGQLCVREASEALVRLARRGLAHDARPAARSVGLSALRVLTGLGGDAKKAAAAVIAQAPDREQLGRAIAASAGARCEPTPLAGAGADGASAPATEAL